MSDLALIRQDLSNRSISFTDRAIAILQEHIALTALIGKIETPEENQAAVEAVAVQRKLEKQLEEARVDAKKPSWDEGKRIDEIANTFKAPLQEEIARIGKLMGDYATLLDAKRRDAEAAQRRDLDELERQKRQQAAQATTHEEREAIIEKFDRFAASVPAPAPVELPKGQSAKQDWDFVVEDIHALYKAAPHCVKLEVKKVELKELLSRRDGNVDGVKATPVMKVNVRPERERKPLELTGGAA